MKKNNNLILPGLALICGAVAGVLRKLLMDTGIDEKGLLTPGNPLMYTMWAVTIGFLAALIFFVRKLKDGSFDRAVPACKVRAVLAVTGGGLLAVQSLQILSGQRLTGALGLLAGACMMAAGVFRWSGKRPTPLFHCGVCAYFIVRLILNFQTWGADPQLQDYAMQLLACVSLMLFAFHRTSCDAELVNRRRTAFFGLAAVFFCVASLSDSAEPLFYAACGIWTIGTLCDLNPLPEEPAQEAEEA